LNTPTKIEFLGKPISGPFTIPSGIVATAVPIIERIFRTMPEVGVMTTKSIGLEPRPGYREPIFSQYAPGCFVNAVGLTNPGAHKSAELFAELQVPQDRFLLISIFGGSVEEFVEVARILAPFADGLELNLSCPHASGYGMAMGQDPQLVREITAAVKAAVDVPVVPKLTPNAPNIGEIAQAAVAGGADALCAINTDVPIIGCGGISCADDARAYQSVGASIFGVGSALIGMTTDEMEAYFKVLAADFDDGADKLACNGAESLVQYDVDMGFRQREDY